MHPSLSRMNELVLSGTVRKNHCQLQEIGHFTSLLGNIYEDPLRGNKNLHKEFPSAIFQQECLRNAVNGKQALNIYLGKHLCGKNSGGIGKSEPACLPEPSLVNHAGLSPSS